VRSVSKIVRNKYAATEPDICLRMCSGAPARITAISELFGSAVHTDLSNVNTVLSIRSKEQRCR